MPPERAERGGNLRALGLIQVFRLVSGFAINVLLMRGLGVEGFGVYGYVLILVNLASFGATLGMDRLIKVEIAREPALAARRVATGLAASLGLSAVTFAGILAWAWGVDGRTTVILAAAMASVALSLRSLAVIPVAAFHGTRRMGLGVAGEGVGRTVLVGATAVFLALHLGVVAVFAAQVLDAIVTLGILWRSYRRHISQEPLATTRVEVLALLRGALPFGLNSLFVAIYLTVDVVLLGCLKGDVEVGLYRGAVMLLSLFPIVADTISTGIFPRMAQHLGDREAAGRELRFLTRILLAVSVPVAVGGVMTAKPLMVLLGGEEFAASALLFTLMVPLLPLRYLDNAYGMVLQALDRPADQTRGSIIAAVFNVAANLLLIPRYGALAAAWVTVATEVVLIVWLRARIRPLVTGGGALAALVRVGVPVACMAAAIWVLPPVHVTLTIAAGGAVYAAVGLLTGAWHPRDFSRLRKV
jgi:O-antigen/teichoic acid export membrane protein